MRWWRPPPEAPEPVVLLRGSTRYYAPASWPHKLEWNTVGDMAVLPKDMGVEGTDFTFLIGCFLPSRLANRSSRDKLEECNPAKRTAGSRSRSQHGRRAAARPGDSRQAGARPRWARCRGSTARGRRDRGGVIWQGERRERCGGLELIGAEVLDDLLKPEHMTYPRLAAL